jgi:3D (Asp-Asp-Asp) domain-containing protein
MRVACAMLALAVAAACATAPRGLERTLDVRASAYTSRHAETDEHPTIAAWGDELEPGMQAIAVSSDLLDLGLRRGTRVRIDGLEGEWVVLDRMASRWTRKIDLYMGEDVRAARRWGIRKVRIRWSEPASIASGG